MALSNKRRWEIGDTIIAGIVTSRSVEIEEGISLTQIQQCVRIARAFPPETRIKGLSWSHFRVVAYIRDPVVRNEWIAKAVKNCWDVIEFSRNVHQRCCDQCGNLLSDEGVYRVSLDGSREVANLCGIDCLIGWGMMKRAADEAGKQLSLFDDATR